MAKRGNARSLVEDVYDRLRQEIFDGQLRPGQALQPGMLSQQYGASITVVREALTVLAGERLVAARTGKGFFIPNLDPLELQDVTTVRCNLESLAIRLAVERGGVDWESELIAAHHRLTRTPRREPSNPHHLSPAWSTAHRAFHVQLIAACGIPMLLDMCQQLAASTELYRVWAAPLPQSTSRDVGREHQDILDAVLARDSDAASERLTQHYEATARLVMANWSDTLGRVQQVQD